MLYETLLFVASICSSSHINSRWAGTPFH